MSIVVAEAVKAFGGGVGASPKCLTHSATSFLPFASVKGNCLAFWLGS